MIAETIGRFGGGSIESYKQTLSHREYSYSVRMLRRLI